METEKLVEKLETADSLEEYLDTFGAHCNEAFSFSRCFEMLFKAKGLKKMDVLERSQVEHVYAHEMIRGKRKPSRDKVLMMAFGLMLDIPETQLILRHSGYSPLSPKLRRDAIILYALTHAVGVPDLNTMLDEKDLAPLL